MQKILMTFNRGIKRDIEEVPVFIWILEESVCPLSLKMYNSLRTKQIFKS